MTQQIIIKSEETGRDLIVCKGEPMLATTMDWGRMVVVAKWILNHAVNRISGPTENALNRMLDLNKSPDPVTRTVLGEFNPLVP